MENAQEGVQGGLSDADCAVNFGEGAIEGAERNLAGVTRDLEDHAVAEAERRAETVELQGLDDDVRILNRELLVLKKHLNRIRHLAVTQPKRAVENPHSFR